MKRQHGNITGSARRPGSIACKALLAAAASALVASGLPSAALAAAGSDPAGSVGAAKLISDASAAWGGALIEADQAGYSATSSTVDTSAQAEEKAASLPSKYDLRDPNGDGDTSDSVVTPVKFQSPWNTCWAHAAIAASETSILSELNTTYAKTGLDLSELHLAWFAYSPVTAAFGGAAQAGEGLVLDNPSNSSSILHYGGYAGYATTVFTSGVGPVSESVAPYKNDEGYIQCSVTEPNAGDDAEPTEMSLTQAQIDEKIAQGYTVEKLHYARFKGSSWEPTTWGLDESLRTQQEYRLEESYSLPQVGEFNSRGYWVGVNQEGIDAVKEQLVAGRGVAIYYHQETPSEGFKTQFINPETWAQYTYDTDAYPDHAVAIVGYDDNYSKDNFLQGEGQTPEGDGAFLVKNSYGASTNEFPNKNDWGEVDENGNHTGYFWLSYYDTSIRDPETFNYDFDPDTMDEDYDINQYDFMAFADMFTATSDDKASSANEFTASEDCVIRGMTCKTAKPNTDVTYELYVLDSDDSEPTQGKLAYTGTEHYEYGGFHRLMMDSSDYVALRKGQRYAVVITQKCLTDGKYYQIASRNKNDGTVYKGANIVAKVNKGESWTMFNGHWTDWVDVTTVLKWQDSGKVIDNLPIKSYSLERSWASVKQLTKLDKAVTKAKKTLKTVTVSKNGKKVSKSKTWVTKAQYKKLKSAVATGKKLVSAAGSYKKTLSTTTPSSSAVKAATKAINAVKASKGKA